MGIGGKIAFGVVLLGIIYVYVKNKQIPPVPTLEEIWWAPGLPQKEDTTIRPFKIQVSDEVIKDLKRRLDTSLPLQPPLKGVNHNYGINTELLQEIVDYWKNKYDWKKREEYLNQYSQFQTNIQGLNIHFIHVKPKNVPTGVEVVPILLLHGWPGSVREFYDIIRVLTKPQKGRNFVFEVVCPSLPGYGFSDGASKPGMAPLQMAQILNKLMKRLKFNHYYVQGGDWGSAIARATAILYPENVIGVHRNFCFENQLLHWKTFVGAYFPSLFFTEKEIQKRFPLAKQFSFTLLEFGYYHIQASKPDTVGVALRESPIGLAAYIIEKFITWTNPAFKDLPDGGLKNKYAYDQLLDNVMIYWVTRSITTSFRLYAEVASQSYQDLKIDKIPIQIPSGCNRFEHELGYALESILRETNTNLIHLTDFDDGGHFAALELPEVLGKDIFDFVQKVRNLQKSEINSEL